MGFWNALSALAPVAPAMSDAADLRTARQQDAAKFASDQALAQARLTVDKLAAQEAQQRLRAGNQPMFKEGSQPTFNPVSGTYQQPAWDDKKQAYSMVDVPGVSPEEQEKYQLDSFKKNRAAAQALIPDGKPEDWDYLGYTLSGMKPPPAAKFTPLPGAAGQPQLGPDGKSFVVYGRNVDGQIVANPVEPGYKPPAPKTLPPATQYMQLYTKKLLADRKQGPPLTAEENAQMQSSLRTMDEPGIAKMQALGQAYAQYHITPITDDSGAAVDVPIAAVLAANKAGTPPRTAAAGTADAADKKNQQLAMSAIQQIDRMKAILKADPGLTGPGSGQLTRLQMLLGAQSPDAQQFLISSLFASEHGVAVFGGRNIHTINDLNDALGSMKTNPAALSAALDVVKETMTPWLTANNRLQGPRTSGGGGGPQKFKTGDFFMQGGHKFKATAVDKNGKVTAADPVG